MTYDKMLKHLGYDTYTAYDEYTPLNKKSLNAIYGRYCGVKKEDKKKLDNVTINVGSQTYRARDVEFTQSVSEYPEIEVHTMLTPYNKISTTSLSIKEVIFNPPATIVFWSDNTKTVVKANYEYDVYDPEKGIAMAIAKKMMGDNKYEYYHLFKHWLKKWEKQNPTIDDFFVPGEY